MVSLCVYLGREGRGLQVAPGCSEREREVSCLSLSSSSSPLELGR